MHLALSLGDGSTGLFPQAEVRQGATPVPGSPFNLVDHGNGSYSLDPAAPAAGDYDVVFKVYEGSYGGTPSTLFPFSTSTTLHARDPIEDQVWDAQKTDHLDLGSFGEALVAAAGHAGLRALLDGGAGNPEIVHDSNNQLKASRLRIFPDDASYSAAAPGAADGADGEMMRIVVDIADYDPALVSAVPTILARFGRKVT